RTLMIRQTFLKVWANPWHALDHMGRPAGHCAKERSASTPGHAGYVGGQIVASAPIVLEPGHAGTPDQDTSWHFDRKPVQAPDPVYDRQKVATGELFPADLKTVTKCAWQAPDAGRIHAESWWAQQFEAGNALDELLEVAKREAYDKWKAAFGEDPEDVD